MAYLTEPIPAYGKTIVVAPGIRRVVARNPSLMTYHGTNTYLVETPDGTIVIDPGPDDAEHVAAVLNALDGPPAALLLTHSHRDHSGAVSTLRAATGAPLWTFHAPTDPSLEPDGRMQDGGTLAGLVAIHTPGHASDHICISHPSGILFSGDHVMSWSSSIVSRPDGDMAAYMASLVRIMARDHDALLPGHGPILRQPRDFIADLLRHRHERERAILDLVRESALPPACIAKKLYANRDIRLQPAAQRNVLAHLAKLESEGLVARSEDRWLAT